MARYSRRRRTPFNPFISLTDVLFNLTLVLIFASALLAQDVNRRFAENREFANRLASLQLERDELAADLEITSENLEDALDSEASLEEQIRGLVDNLDTAQARQNQLSRRINLVVGRLQDARDENDLLNEELTVVVGRVEGLEEENTVLSENATLLLGELGDAEALVGNLRDEVGALSRNNFLVVELEWLTESHDLDLHVVDPNGNRFYWDQASYEGEDARLTLDNRLGARPNKPGLEIWTARELELGTYRIEVGLWGCGRTTEQSSYTACQSDAVANILLRHRDGDELIQGVTLAANNSYAQVNGQEFRLGSDSFGRLQTVAEVDVVESDGKLELEFRPADNLGIDPVGSRS